jgi:hypothetical protein
MHMLLRTLELAGKNHLQWRPLWWKCCTAVLHFGCVFSCFLFSFCRDFLLTLSTLQGPYSTYLEFFLVVIILARSSFYQMGTMGIHSPWYFSCGYLWGACKATHAGWVKVLTKHLSFVVLKAPKLANYMIASSSGGLDKVTATSSLTYFLVYLWVVRNSDKGLTSCSPSIAHRCVHCISF